MQHFESHEHLHAGQFTAARLGLHVLKGKSDLFAEVSYDGVVWILCLDFGSELQRLPEGGTSSAPAVVLGSHPMQSHWMRYHGLVYCDTLRNGQHTGASWLQGKHMRTVRVLDSSCLASLAIGAGAMVSCPGRDGVCFGGHCHAIVLVAAR